ncbi:MAG: hypothetical protein ACOCRK_09430 [bacterium]
MRSKIKENIKNLLLCLIVPSFLAILHFAEVLEYVETPIFISFMIFFILLAIKFISFLIYAIKSTIKNAIYSRGGYTGLEKYLLNNKDNISDKSTDKYEISNILLKYKKTKLNETDLELLLDDINNYKRRIQDEKYLFILSLEKNTVIDLININPDEKYKEHITELIKEYSTYLRTNEDSLKDSTKENIDQEINYLTDYLKYIKGKGEKPNYNSMKKFKLSFLNLNTYPFVYLAIFFIVFIIYCIV